MICKFKRTYFLYFVSLLHCMEMNVHYLAIVTTDDAMMMIAEKLVETPAGP